MQLCTHYCTLWLPVLVPTAQWQSHQVVFNRPKPSHARVAARLRESKCEWHPCSEITVLTVVICAVPLCASHCISCLETMMLSSLQSNGSPVELSYQLLYQVVTQKHVPKHSSRSHCGCSEYLVSYALPLSLSVVQTFIHMLYRNVSGTGPNQWK